MKNFHKLSKYYSIFNLRTSFLILLDLIIAELIVENISRKRSWIIILLTRNSNRLSKGLFIIPKKNLSINYDGCNYELLYSVDLSTKFN